MNLQGFAAFAVLCSAFPVANAAPSLVCTSTAVPAMVRSEGLTEQMGDVLLSCDQGTPGATVAGSLVVSLPVAVTNRLSAGNVVDAVLTADTGNGPVSTGATPILGGANSVAFTNVNFTLPAAGKAVLRISNVRAAVAQQGVTNTAPIIATLAWSNAGTTQVLFSGTQVYVAVPRPGLLSASVSTLVNCHGSALPDKINVTNLFAAGTAVSATRVTAGFPGAFEPLRTGLDSGVRMLLRYSGFPAGARLFVPDAIAGSDATQPTATGLMGGTASAGKYTPGNRTLLLVRIVETDANGAGGTPLYTPGAAGSGPVVLNGASEVPLTGGSGMAVYEVADAKPVTQAHAEIPTWLGLAPTGGASSAPRESVTFAPVSDVAVATETDPIPRFLATEPGTDCGFFGDCGSFPRMVVRAPPLEYTAESGGLTVGDWIAVDNAGGGTLSWTAHITYTKASNWASLAYAPGWHGGGAVKLIITPAPLAPGVYEATLTIDGGNLGFQSLPVKLTVTPPKPKPVAPQINAVVHAATWAAGPLVPGSLGTITGSHLAGTSVALTFDGIAAKLLYTGDSQINLEVPAALAGHTSAQMTITVDGVSCQPYTVQLTPMAPGIFSNGILNQDNSVNSSSDGAEGGSVIQVFATGLPLAGIATITAKIHDVWITSPDYAGPAPGLPGVQQINLRVPDGWPPMTTSVVVCATSISAGARVCSPQASFTVK